MAQHRCDRSQKAITAGDKQIREEVPTERSKLHRRGGKRQRQIADIPQSTGATDPGERCLEPAMPSIPSGLCEEAGRILHSTIQGLSNLPKGKEGLRQGSTTTVRPRGHTNASVGSASDDSSVWSAENTPCSSSQSSVSSTSYDDQDQCQTRPVLLGLEVSPILGTSNRQ